MHESRQLWRKIDPTDPGTVTRRFIRQRRVLDHGRVKPMQWMGTDATICHAARVLEDYAPWRGVDDVKLLEHLYRNLHTTPFEHTAVSLYIKAPIFVFRQWHRHRTQSYNEMSARYKVLPAEYYVPRASDVGEQSKKNHQSRIIHDEREADPTALDAVDRIQASSQMSYDDYMWLMEIGVPRELARSVTTMNMYSEMWVTANLWNWLKFLTLRNDEHAQYEIRVYAEVIEQVLCNYYPITMQIFDGVRKERKEMEEVYEAWCANGRMKFSDVQIEGTPIRDVKLTPFDAAT